VRAQQEQKVRAQFTIGLHSRDLALLLQIKEFFGCGIIVKNDPQSEISFRVSSLQDLTNIIIPHFLKYPLLAPLAFGYEQRKKLPIFIYLNKLLN